MSRLSMACVLIAAVIACKPCAVNAEQIALFDYHGDHTQFDTFVGMLGRRLANLPVAVFQSASIPSSDRAHLTDLKIVNHGADTLADTTEALNWMKNQGDVLSVLQGTIL